MDAIKKTLLLCISLTLTSIALAQMDIFQAATIGSPEDIKTSVTTGQDVNSRDEYGQTPLMYAAGNNSNAEAITTLIALGADINTKSNAEWTAAHYAARDNTNPSVIQVLIDAGADLTLGTNEGIMASELARQGNTVSKQVIDNHFRNQLSINPMLGDVYSFYTSPFCQLYGCLFTGKEDVNIQNIHMYTTYTYRLMNSSFTVTVNRSPKWGVIAFGASLAEVKSEITKTDLIFIDDLAAMMTGYPNLFNAYSSCQKQNMEHSGKGSYIGINSLNRPEGYYQEICSLATVEAQVVSRDPVQVREVDLPYPRFGYSIAFAASE